MRITFFFAGKRKCICRNYIIKITLLHKCVSCVYMQDIFPHNSFDYFDFILHFVHYTYVNTDFPCVFTMKYYDVDELRIGPITYKDKLFRCNRLAHKERVIESIFYILSGWAVLWLVVVQSLPERWPKLDFGTLY
jgi:hypothetical protein